MVLLRRERVCYILLAKTLKFNIKENEDAAWNLGITLLSIDKCLHMTYNCILLARKQRIEMSSVYLLHVSIVPPSIHAIVVICRIKQFLMQVLDKLSYYL